MQEKEAEILKLLEDEDWSGAFNLLVDAYTQPLYWHIRKLVLIHADADDCLQNTFIQVWKNLPKFRRDSKLYTWLYRIATNEALGHLRKQKKKHRLGQEEGSRVLSRLEADAFYQGDEAERKLMEAVSQLPEKQQVVFKLKYFSDLKYDQMAEQLGTSVGALKASYHHATQKIKQWLQPD